MPNRKGEPPNRSKAVKKRQYASRTPQARSYKTPGRMTESGMALGTVTRAAVKAAARAGSKRTKAGGGRSYANTEAKAGVKSGQLPSGGRFAPKSVTARKRSVPTKPSARSKSAKYRGRKKK